MNFIKYKSGYKYQLAEDFSCLISLQPGVPVSMEFIHFENHGVGGQIFIRKGYAWDGPSGPAIDTKNFMRGSLVHDALYQLMRHGFLDKNLRDSADRILQGICIEDGMWPIRAWWVYKSLSLFGQAASDPDNIRPIIIAP